MPRKKYGKKRYKPRGKIIKYNKRNALYNSIPMGLSTRKTLRYFERNIILNPGVAGIMASYTFSLNGLYDPNITGVGHQPMGFDQLMLMYNNYTVVGAKARVVFRNTDQTRSVDVGLTITTSATAPTNLDDLIENGRCKWKQLGFVGASSDRTTTNIIAKAGIAKYLQIKDIMDDDLLYGNVGANPTKQLYLHIFARQPENVDSDAVYAQVMIDFISVFTRPITLGQS